MVRESSESAKLAHVDDDDDEYIFYSKKYEFQ